MNYVSVYFYLKVCFNTIFCKAKCTSVRKMYVPKEVLHQMHTFKVYRHIVTHLGSKQGVNSKYHEVS